MLPSEKRAIILAEIRKHPEGISAQQMANSNLINLRIKDRNVVISTYYETARHLEKEGKVKRLPWKKGEPLLWVIA